ncbi:MAG: biliverdin-producing heme oxygenase [Desulfamplus sp.]|nr:biliverdin-producing heme oxygenase [Desulfamplus sp.]
MEPKTKISEEKKHNPKLTQMLREATRDIHSRLEGTPFARALMKKNLNENAYAGFIRVMAVIHGALEKSLDACTHPGVRQVWTGELRRLPSLLQDNYFFRRQLIPDAPDAIGTARKAASHIMLLSEQEPMALLGCLYVLGGSTRGAVILSPLVAEAFKMTSGKGLTYLSRHSIQGPGEWAETSALMDDLVISHGDVQSMIAAAKKLFGYLVTAFEALWPLDDTAMEYTSSALNPESGTHPVPRRREDMLAVLAASDRCLAEYPYFLYRYGMRGRHFADADGAWLATLPECGQEVLQSQVSWLGGVLSVRGMPQILLARHLEILTEELISARSDNAPDWNLLTLAARDIREKLENRFPISLRADQLRMLQHDLGCHQDFAATEAMDLIFSALTDEAQGHQGSAQSLLKWFTDSHQFPQKWITAINARIDDLTALSK